jgi:hypothetical protein
MDLDGFEWGLVVVIVLVVITGIVKLLRGGPRPRRRY